MSDQRSPDSAAVGALLARARRDVDDGTLPSVQLALAHSGRIVAEATYGAAGPDSRYTVFSVTKAYVAAAAWVLIGEGLLTPATKVADVVPEFATNGKETVTLEHLLTHTAGFPRAPMRPEQGATAAGRLARFATWRLDWPPGTAMEYHATSAHWVVAELIERVTGKDFRTVVADRVATPLGLPALQLGPSADESSDVLDVAVIGGTGNDELGLAEVNTGTLLRYNEAAVRAAGVPGAGAVAHARDVALFYQGLLHNPGSLWDPDVLADGTGTVRCTFVDPLRGVSANRTLGLVVAGDDGNAQLRDFGRASGPRAFGSAGVGGQIAWADPDSGLSFCWLTNGLDADLVATFKRSASLSTLAARCVVPL